MDLSAVIGSLATGTYTVTRTGAGTYGGPVDGRYVSPTPSTFTISAVVQPTKGRDLLILPEGVRTRQTITIFTTTQLQTATAPEGNEPDTVSYSGSTFQVQTCEPWSEAGHFYKAIAAKVGQ